MYGENVLNAHYALRYGFTKEFVNMYRSLRYKGIEIPATLVRPFHVFVRGHVNRLQNNRSFVKKMKVRHRLYRIRDAQKALSRMPKRVRNLSAYSHRKAILMPARLVELALKQFRKHQVILVVSNIEDRRALKGKKLPSRFKIFYYHRAVHRVRVSGALKKQVRKAIARSSRRARNHRFLTRPSFRKWLYINALKSIRAIEALEQLIRKHPIGAIIDHAEIVNPGATLVMVARKYGLPFVKIPQLLMTDRSVIPARATQYYVWGTHFRDWLRRRGVPPSKIKIVGNMRFEMMRKKRVRNVSQFRRRWRIPRGHLVVVVATQPFVPKVNNKLVRWLRVTSRLCLRGRLPYVFLLKPHPQDRTRYRQMLRARNVRVASRTDNVYEAIRNGNLMATISSNTAIEAAFFRKPLFVLQPEIPYDYDHHNNLFNAYLARSGAGQVIAGPTQWYGALRKFRHSAAYRKQLARRGQLFLRKTMLTRGSPQALIRRRIVRLLRRSA